MSESIIFYSALSGKIEVNVQYFKNNLSKEGTNISLRKSFSYCSQFGSAKRLILSHATKLNLYITKITITNNLKIE